MLLILAAAAVIDMDTSPPRTPSASALARSLTSAMHKRIDAADVRNIRCEGLFYFPQGDSTHSPPSYACKWDQRKGKVWISYSSYFDFDNQRWRLKRSPDSDLPTDASSTEEQRLRAWLIPHLRKGLADSEDKLSYRYGYTLVDLNDDGKDEAIVTIWGRDTCGTGGCPMNVEVDRGGVWHELSETVRTREPIRILSTKHHGWHDIGVIDGGGGMPCTIESPVTFNGRVYEGSPTDRPVRKGVHGRTVLTDDMVNRPLF